MTEIDYSIFQRREVSAEELSGLRFDLLVSAFNSSERVQIIHANVAADVKHWVVQPEYEYSAHELPVADVVFAPGGPLSESEFWFEYFELSGFHGRWRGAKVAFDITGLMRPHLMLLVRLLKEAGLKTASFLYGDPVAYAKDDRTVFSKGAIDRVEQVIGFEGIHTVDSGERDILIIGSGYDSELIMRAAESKRSARKWQLFGLPSLQPHMYRESQLRAAVAAESVGALGERSILFAPANDPFVTAQVLHDRIAKQEVAETPSNYYLSPLGTKAQALGFAWFYLRECQDQPFSIVFPYAPYYTRETSYGLVRTHVYTLELDWLP